jgi:hypothetical protein
LIPPGSLTTDFLPRGSVKVLIKCNHVNVLMFATLGKLLIITPTKHTNIKGVAHITWIHSIINWHVASKKYITYFKKKKKNTHTHRVRGMRIIKNDRYGRILKESYLL